MTDHAPHFKRIGVVKSWGGGEVVVLVDRDLDYYPSPMTSVYVTDEAQNITHACPDCGDVHLATDPKGVTE